MGVKRDLVYLYHVITPRDCSGAVRYGGHLRPEGGHTAVLHSASAHTAYRASTCYSLRQYSRKRSEMPIVSISSQSSPTILYRSPSPLLSNVQLEEPTPLRS